MTSGRAGSVSDGQTSVAYASGSLKLSAMLPIVPGDGAQPGGVEVGEVAGAPVPGQHADGTLLRPRAQLHVAEVVDPRGAEISLDRPPRGVVVAEEGERRPRETDDRGDLLAAAVG